MLWLKLIRIEKEERFVYFLVWIQSKTAIASVVSFCPYHTQIIRWFVCKVPRVAVVIITLHVQAKDRRHIDGFHKHKIEPRYVYIRLQMFSSTYQSVKSIKMDFFRQQIT